MKVLIIKTSSMGDIIHTLPALTDAIRAIPDIQFDWVVEEKFVEIPKWHFAVDRVIPVAIRAWRKKIFSKKTYSAIRHFFHELKIKKYDLIIDAQGLLKSAILSRFARGKIYGLDKNSARESIASYFYHKKISVLKNQHAVTRVRALFAEVLNYSLSDTVPEYGVNRSQFIQKIPAQNYLVFLHGTTWPSKHWPEKYWIELAKLAAAQNLAVYLAWGNETEHARAQRIAAHVSTVSVLPSTTLLQMAEVLATSVGVVAVDTGLCHLAAALGVPTVSLYGPTSAIKTGALGRSQLHLSANTPSCAPCLTRECYWKGVFPSREGEVMQPACLGSLTPERVWKDLISLQNISN